MKSDRDLSACIRIDEERISRSISIPCRIYFELDRENLARIERIIDRQGSLRLQSQQLISLRYYSLINSPVANSDRSSLVFASNYLLDRERFSTTVIRSTIDLTGKVSQEIQQRLWRDRLFASRVIQIHYWLVAEILRQLPLKNKPSIFCVILLWCLSIAVAVAMGYFIPCQLSIKLSLMISMAFIFKLLITHLSKDYLKPWLLRQLIFGFLANKTYKRKWGFKLLAFIT